MESLEINIKTMVKSKCGIQNEELLDKIAKVAIEEVRGRDAQIILNKPKDTEELLNMMNKLY